MALQPAQQHQPPQQPSEGLAGPSGPRSGSVPEDTSAQPGRSWFLTPGNLLVMGMFAAGIAGIYALSLRIGPAAAQADQKLLHAKVEAALSVLEAPPTAAELEQRSSAKAIVGEFYTAARQRQVDVKSLKGNPFVFVDPNPPPPAPKPKPEPEKHTRSAESETRQRAMAALKHLRLQSIMVGPNSTMALISSNLVTTGQTIEGWTVEKITPRQVTLKWKDVTHVLEIE